MSVFYLKTKLVLHFVGHQPGNGQRGRCSRRWRVPAVQHVSGQVARPGVKHKVTDQVARRVHGLGSDTGRSSGYVSRRYLEKEDRQHGQ